jgi:hypothetical protein
MLGKIVAIACGLLACQSCQKATESPLSPSKESAIPSALRGGWVSDSDPTTSLTFRENSPATLSLKGRVSNLSVQINGSKILFELQGKERLYWAESGWEVKGQSLTLSPGPFANMDKLSRSETKARE